MPHNVFSRLKHHALAGFILVSVICLGWNVIKSCVIEPTIFLDCMLLCIMFFVLQFSLYHFVYQCSQFSNVFFFSCHFSLPYFDDILVHKIKQSLSVQPMYNLLDTMRLGRVCLNKFSSMAIKPFFISIQHFFILSNKQYQNKDLQLLVSSVPLGQG